MKSLNFRYLSRLDHLRFFAALLVIFHHFRGNLFAIPQEYNINLGFGDLIKLWLVKGSTGVSLFLVLSAFLFTLICQAGEKKIEYSKFIYNRILRIFPLLIVIVFIIITLNRGNSNPMDILRIFTLQLNTGNPMTGWGHDIFPSGPIWTIAVEFQFYLLFPLLIIFYNRYGYRYLILGVLFLILIRATLGYLNPVEIYYNLYHSIIGRLDQFLIGIMFGVMYVKGIFSKLKNIHYYFLFFSAVTLLSLQFIYFRIPAFSSLVFSFTIEAICWGIIIIAYLGISHRLFELEIFKWISKKIAFLGELSFSMYLLHLPIGIAAGSFLSLGEPDSLTQSLLYSGIRLPFIMAISMLSYYVVEKPFMGLRKKYLIEN